ncbi:nuclear fusion protein KAR5 [Candida albicans P37037]|nr:nuclear fusion protein KAR5 [Candida albicans P37037]
MQISEFGHLYLVIGKVASISDNFQWLLQRNKKYMPSSKFTIC